jgi:hypothetical protein
VCCGETARRQVPLRSPRPVASRPGTGASAQSIGWAYNWTRTPHPTADTVVTLWGSDTKVHLASSNTGKTSFMVPTVPPGAYELRVTNATDVRIEVRLPVTIAPGAVAFTAPAASETWTSLSQQMIQWTYAGNPGPLELVLTNSATGAAAAKLVTNVELRDGWGRRSVTVPLADGLFLQR